MDCLSLWFIVMSDASNAGYRFKLSMYWGAKWKIYFALYYALTYEAAYAALDGYHFPITKNRGWCIEELSTREVDFSPREWNEPPDEGFTEAFNQVDEEEESPPEQMPLMLPDPKPPAEFKSIWKATPSTKRCL